MAQKTRVCSDCGATAEDGNHLRSRIDHTWSDADALSRFIARVEADDGDMTIVDFEDNDDWQWVEVSCEGRDPLGDSEGLANYIKREGFSFCALGEGDNSVRFNRKK